MGSVLTRLSLLVTMFLLVGCQLTQTTRTSETEKSLAFSVCKAWKPVTYSSKDTEQTSTEARANNAARTSYCAGTDKP